MNLGLYRREHLGSGDPALIGQAAIDQFQRTHGAIGEWAEAEHHDDGTHAEITADSVTVDGPVVADTLLLTGPPRDDGATLTVANAGPDPTGNNQIDSVILATAPAGAANLVLFGGGVAPANGGGGVFISSADASLASLTHRDGSTFLSVGNTSPYLGLDSGIAERNRTVAMGDPIFEPFNAGDYAALAPMTWTVDAAAANTNVYTRIGRSIFWQVAVLSGSGTSAIGGTPTSQLRITVPGGLSLITTGALFGNKCALALDATGIIPARVQIATATSVLIVKDDGANWAGSVTLIFQVQMFEA